MKLNAVIQLINSQYTKNYISLIQNWLNANATNKVCMLNTTKSKVSYGEVQHLIYIQSSHSI